MFNIPELLLLGKSSNNKCFLREKHKLLSIKDYYHPEFLGEDWQNIGVCRVSLLTFFNFGKGFLWIILYAQKCRFNTEGAFTSSLQARRVKCNPF